MTSPSDFPIFPDLKGKVALITGIGQTGIPDSSTWGNGAATARVLAHSGAKIFGCDLNLAAANYTRTRLLQDNPEAICDVVAADMTDTSSIQAFIDAAMAKHGRIDILYNNVGMTAPADPATTPDAVWQSQLDLNLNSVFRTTRLVLPIMESQPTGGSIINNASLTAIRYIGKPQIGYATAKAAVVQYTNATACMYAARHVRLNCVVPGLMYTPLVENLERSSRPEDREVARRITQHNVPIGRMGDGFDVGNAVAFLASAAAKYITGQSIVMDGGLSQSTGTGFGS